MLDLADPTNPAKNEVTTYVYGVDTAGGSALAANSLLFAIQYPTDSASSRVEMKYNRLGEVTERSDQNGTVHEYGYDLLGRPTADVAATLGTGIDSAVRRLTTSYNNRGLPELLTSWSTTSGSTSTDIVNQVQQDYNDFAQPTSDWQEHAGAVDTAAGAGQTLRVQYAYASGVASGSPTNFIRPTELTYPDGRTIVYTYGGNAAIDYHINRMKTIKEGSTTGDGLVQYVFLGMSRYVRANYWIPETRLDLWGGTAGTYTGLDQFNRPTNCKWIDTGANPDVDIVDLEYGYNRNSVPTYRADNLSASSDNYDELYGRDGLDRLDNFQRGTLNAGKTAITTLAFEQDWALDQVANWDAFNEDANGDGADNLVQTRTHNFSNEVTGVTNTTGGAWNAPTYDSAGNTTQCPAPDDPATSTSDRKLTYDAWNRVVKATDNAGTPATLAEYQYDARGFRVVRKGYTSGTHDVTYHDYFTAGWQCIEERLDDPSNGDPPALDRQYVWGTRYVDELVQRKRDTTGNGVLNEELYAMNDRQFNVVGLTDETGAVVQRMTLTAYGEVTFLTSSYGSSTNTKDWRHVFQGLRTDDGTGFIDNRMRILHSILGRDLQRDPLGYPDGLNAYAAYHVMSGGVDPWGEFVPPVLPILPVLPLLPQIIRLVAPAARWAVSRTISWLLGRVPDQGLKAIPMPAPAQLDPEIVDDILYETATDTYYEEEKAKCPVTTRRNEKGCLIYRIPSAQQGGHDHHDAYVLQLQGNMFGVFVKAPDGTIASYDGTQRKKQVFEAKTGYGWLSEFHQNTIDALLGNGLNFPFPGRLDGMREAAMRAVKQHREQREVARKCGLHLDVYVDTQAGQKGLRRLGIKAKHVPFNPFDPNIPPFNPFKP